VKESEIEREKKRGKRELLWSVLTAEALPKESLILSFCSFFPIPFFPVACEQGDQMSL
jgi:hypothetical protein